MLAALLLRGRLYPLQTAMATLFLFLFLFLFRSFLPVEVELSQIRVAHSKQWGCPLRGVWREALGFGKEGSQHRGCRTVRKISYVSSSLPESDQKFFYFAEVPVRQRRPLFQSQAPHAKRRAKDIGIILNEQVI